MWRGVAALSRALPLVFWSNLALAPFLGAYLGLAALAFCSRALRAEATAPVMLGVAVYFLVVSGGPAAYARFRHPIMPIVCVYAAYSLDWLRGQRSGGYRKANLYGTRLNSGRRPGS